MWDLTPYRPPRPIRGIALLYFIIEMLRYNMTVLCCSNSNSRGMLNVGADCQTLAPKLYTAVDLKQHSLIHSCRGLAYMLPDRNHNGAMGTTLVHCVLDSVLMVETRYPSQGFSTDFFSVSAKTAQLVQWQLRAHRPR
jgi:hypothetical protein